MSAYRVVPARPPSRALPWMIAALLGLAILVAWGKAPPEDPAFRAQCQALGGLTLRTDDRLLCLWAGAVIPVNLERKP